MKQDLLAWCEAEIASANAEIAKYKAAGETGFLCVREHTLRAEGKIAQVKALIKQVNERGVGA